MRRGQAEELLDRVRQLAAGGEPHGVSLGDALRALLASYPWNLAPLRACTGEAHRNPYIDNCHDCAPRWGFVGARERIT